MRPAHPAARGNESEIVVQYSVKKAEAAVQAARLVRILYGSAPQTELLNTEY